MRYDKDIFEAVLLVCNNEGEGREAIDILESLGAKPFSVRRHNDIPEYKSYAYVNKDKWIKFITNPELSTGYRFTKLSPSEYRSKYPYRPGDEVKIPSVDDDIVFRITEAIWKNDKVEYYIAAINQFFSARSLHPVRNQVAEAEDDIKEVPTGHDVAVPNCPICPELLDENKNEVKKVDEKLVMIDMTSENCHDEVEIILGNDFELKTEDGKIKLVRKSIELPKTYTECCKLLGAGYNHYLGYLANEKRQDFEYRLSSDLSKLARLIVCRNAYWKLTGDPSDEANCYSIIKRSGEPTITICESDNKGILAFLKCKAAEEFIKNFNELIKDCKLV